MIYIYIHLYDANKMMNFPEQTEAERDGKRTIQITYDDAWDVKAGVEVLIQASPSS